MKDFGRQRKHLKNVSAQVWSGLAQRDVIELLWHIRLQASGPVMGCKRHFITTFARLEPPTFQAHGRDSRCGL